MSCTLLVINTYGYICMHTNEKAHLHKMCIHSANMQCEQLDLNKLIKYIKCTSTENLTLYYIACV